MAMSGKDFIKWMNENKEKSRMEVTIPCYKCGRQFDEDGDRHYVSQKPCCSDCYYEALGDEMEKNPPINPKLRGVNRSKKVI